VRLFRPVPGPVARAVSLLVVAGWIVTMGVVLNRAYLQARSFNLATDLARYGTAAEWRGVYYRGEKIGFTVSQTTPTPDGFELLEDARLQMSLLGATTAAAIRTSAQLDHEFALRSFDFSLDPGTGPVRVGGRVSGRHISLTIATPSGTQTEERDLDDVPVLSLNLPRRLAAQGFKPGTEQRFVVFDPATLRSETVTIAIGKREVVNVYAPAVLTFGGQQVRSRTNRPVPAFRLELAFAGLRTSSWVTDTGEVVREESPLGLLSVREAPEEAQRFAIGRRIQGDILESAAVLPRRSTKNRIDDPRDVRRIRIRIEGADLASAEMRGAGQSVQGDILEIVDARSLRAEAADSDIARYLRPEPLIESDDPAIKLEADQAVAGVTDSRGRAERLTRRVNAMLDKKPTVSLPSAREVLRTKVGDCNEHTALYVAMARAVGIPARIAVGLAYTRGAFYYHAWPEVYIDEGRGRGLWLPVDPTFNQFPADATHVRMTRGGLDRQAAILPLIGRLKMNIIGLDLAPGSAPILVGRGSPGGGPPLSIPLPVRTGLTCWSSPVSSRAR
jgi:transglutaminase-like putative cysteine protease